VTCAAMYVAACNLYKAENKTDTYQFRQSLTDNEIL